MNFQQFSVPAGCVVLLGLGWQAGGWQGVAVVAGGLVMWLLLHFTRLMTILKRAANRPIGHVDSAVMLNAQLQPGMTLVQVITLTRALGALQSAKDAQPELFRWTDNSNSWVNCEFHGGKLTHWLLVRPSDPQS